MSDDLARDLRAAYGAYEYLREHDLAAASTTSRLLREADLAYLVGRVRDELAELHGAVAGTHGHGGGRDDVVLEAYQALYWLMILAVAAGDRYDHVRPHEQLTSGPCTQTSAAPAVFWADFDHPGGDSAERRRRALRGGFATVAEQCRAAGVAVAEAVRRDLAELHARPYLAPYWSAAR